jgi:prophage regulatory protein
MRADRGSRTLAQAKRDGSPAARGRFLRIDDVVATTGLSRATIYRLVKSGAFPRSWALTARAVGWWERDVELWLDSRLPVA